ncbi:hypothetical protein AB6A23_05800 [Paenibacillus tarimensis]
MAYVLTTGVLKKHVRTDLAIVEYVNYSNRRIRVLFRVIDWTNRRRRVIHSDTNTIRPGRNDSQAATLASRVVRYEIEITVMDSIADKKKNQFIINCFGKRGGFEEVEPLNTPLFEGNTVLYKDLVLKRAK